MNDNNNNNNDIIQDIIEFMTILNIDICVIDQLIPINLILNICYYYLYMFI